MNRIRLFPRAGTSAIIAAGLALGAAGLTGGTAGHAQDNPGNPIAAQPSAEGQQLYEQICQACHMADAKGGAGAGTGVPALAGNAHLADKAFAITTVHDGRGGMPRFAGMLTDAQIAAVLTYVRSHFNAYPDPVTEADVQKVASAPAAQSDCNTCVH